MAYSYTAIMLNCHSVISQHCQIARVPYSQTCMTILGLTAKLQYFHTAILPYCQTTILPSCQTAIFLKCHTTKLYNIPTAILPECHYTIQGTVKTARLSQSIHHHYHYIIPSFHHFINISLNNYLISLFFRFII